MSYTTKEQDHGVVTVHHGEEKVGVVVPTRHPKTGDVMTHCAIHHSGECYPTIPEKETAVNAVIAIDKKHRN